MEETIWIYFGILAFIIGLGLTISLLKNFSTDQNNQKLFSSLNIFEGQIKNICKSPEDTKLTINIIAPGDSIVYSKEDKVCAKINKQIKCVPSTCALEEKTLINLTSEDAKKFKNLEYKCSLTKKTNNVELECKA